MRLLVIGNAAFDRFLRVERLPAEGESVFGEAAAVEPGGKGLNQAVTAARCGAEVVFCTMLGRDATGLALRRHLAAERLDGPFVLDHPGASDESLILVGPAGENAIVTTRAAAARLGAAAAAAAIDTMAPGDLVLMQGNLRPEVTLEALGLATRRGMRTLLNPSPVQPALLAGLDAVDLLIVNEVEAKAASAAVLSAVLPAVVTTLGARGATLRTAAGETRIEAPLVEALDTTGAGDVLAGVLAGRLALGDGLEAALRLAVKAASAKVARAGTGRGLPAAAELRALAP